MLQGGGALEGRGGHASTRVHIGPLLQKNANKRNSVGVGEGGVDDTEKETEKKKDKDKEQAPPTFFQGAAAGKEPRTCAYTSTAHTLVLLIH